MTTLAKEYNLSDNGLRKICMKLSVPIPAAGHWAKIRAGYVIPRIPLPPKDESHPTEYELNILTPRLTKPQSIYTDSIEIGKRLTNPHTIVKNYLDMENSNQEFKHNQDNIIHLSVSKAVRHHAILVLDSVLKILERNNYRVKVPSDRYKRTVDVSYDNITLGFTLCETQKQIKIEPKTFLGPSFDYQYDGRLKLSIDIWSFDEKIQKNFQDGKLAVLEDKLPQFINNLMLSFRIERRKLLKWEREHQERERVERLRLEAAYRIKEEKRKQELLLGMTKDWVDAEHIRSFVREINLKYSAEALPVNLAEWVDWVIGFANAIDPMGNPELFREYLAKND